MKKRRFRPWSAVALLWVLCLALGCQSAPQNRVENDIDGIIAIIEVIGESYEVDEPEVKKGLVPVIEALQGSTPKESRLRNARQLAYYLTRDTSLSEEARYDIEKIPTLIDFLLMDYNNTP